MTVTELWISVDTPVMWKAALNGISHAFGHTWESCRAMAADSGRRTFLYALETDAGRFVCPVEERPFGRRMDLVTPYGFSGFVGEGDSRDITVRWTDAARRRGYVCAYVVNNPALHSCVNLPGSTIAKKLYVLDLTLSSEDLWERLSPYRRRELERWDTTTQRIVTERDRLTDFFLDNYQGFFSRRNALSTHGLSRNSLAHLADTSTVLMAGVEREGELTAGSMFGYTADSADYLFNVSTPHGRGHSAALIWWAVARLRSLDVPHLNLGAGLVEGDGIAWFKARFGAVKMPVPVNKHIFDPVAYAELCRRTGTDASEAGGYFPAYRNTRHSLEAPMNGPP